MPSRVKNNASIINASLVDAVCSRILYFSIFRPVAMKKIIVEMEFRRVDREAVMEEAKLLRLFFKPKKAGSDGYPAFKIIYR